MAKNPQQEKGKGLDVNVLALGALGAAITLWIIWFAFHNFITWLALRTRQWELLALGTLAQPFLGPENNMLKISQFYSENSSVNLTFGSFVQIMRESGVYVVFIYCPIIIFFGYKIFKLSPTENFKRNHTMDSLAKQESKIWPEIRPPLLQRLDQGDLRRGPWRVSMTEWEFVRAFKLVDYAEDTGEDIYAIPGAPKEENANKEIFNREKARSLFAEQLGEIWNSYKSMPPHMKGLFAAFSVRVAAIPLIDSDAKKSAIKESDRLLRQMASNYADVNGDYKKMDFSWADAVIAETTKSEFVQLAIQRHAYLYTIMATMLQVARSDGVVASAMFTWVRPVDRRLWYTLENVGGYCFVTECAGIAAHWLAEKEIGTRLMYPTIEEAVKGLELGLSLYQEEDEKLALFK